MNLSIDLEVWQTVGLLIDYTIKIFAIGFVPEGRRPSSSNAWLLTILLLPVLGLPLFLLMGSPYINRRRHRIQQEAQAMVENVLADVPDFPEDATVDREVASLIRQNRFLTGNPAVVGVNHGLLADYEGTILQMASAVDQATSQVHVQIYIMSWDNTTDPFFRALERAVERGVKVRLLFDQVGSFKYPGYLKLGKRLSTIGVEWHLMLPLQPWRARFRRPDLRNHRKMLIVDSEVGFLGSLNMIDRAYRARRNARTTRQWVDVMAELSGSVVISMEMLFAVDWYAETGEDLTIAHRLHLQDLPAPASEDAPETSARNLVQLVPSGPGYTTEPNLRMFNSVVHHAKDRLILCSPYFIPDESLLEAVTTACYRGVQVELLVSEKADQFMVHHAQSSYYQVLLEAGVRIYQFPAPFVMHSKFVIADPDGPVGDPLGVVGSSNMDMRSFGLNYEVSLMITQGNLLRQLSDLADTYQRVSRELTLEAWNRRSFFRRYLDNVMRLTSALQ